MPKRPLPEPVRDPGEPLLIEHCAHHSPVDGSLALCWTTNRPASGEVELRNADGNHLRSAPCGEGRNHRLAWKDLDPSASFQARREVGKDINIVTYAHTGLTKAISPPLYLFEANWDNFAKNLQAILSEQTVDMDAVSALSPISYSLKGTPAA